MIDEGTKKLLDEGTRKLVKDILDLRDRLSHERVSGYHEQLHMDVMEETMNMLLDSAKIIFFKTY